MTARAAQLTSHASRTPTIEARAVEKIVAIAADYGVGRAQLVENRSDPDLSGRIPFVHVLHLYERAARLTEDAAFGLKVAERVEPAVFDLLGYLVSHCRTLDDTLDRLARFHGVWNEGIRFRVQRAAHETRLMMDYRCGELADWRQDSEMTLATVVLLAQRLTGQPLLPVRVYFRHARPASADVHQRIFRCPVHFGAAGYELVLPRAVGRLEVLHADEQLGQVLASCAMRLHAPPSAEPGRWTAAARRAAADSLRDGALPLSRAAAALGVSARTLQRRLAAEGTTYEALLQATRRELAETALRDGGQSVAEISDQLGYSEPSALVRAFRRWHGESPRRYGKRSP